jgi:hypothetical protein
MVAVTGAATGVRDTASYSRSDCRGGSDGTGSRGTGLLRPHTDQPPDQPSQGNRCVIGEIERGQMRSIPFFFDPQRDPAGCRPITAPQIHFWRKSKREREGRRPEGEREKKECAVRQK